jgi:hypothetical protein
MIVTRMNNVWIESSGGKNLCLWVEENCVFTEKFPASYPMGLGGLFPWG